MHTGTLMDIYFGIICPYLYENKNEFLPMSSALFHHQPIDFLVSFRAGHLKKIFFNIKTFF